jgi:hypothetical protein
MSPAQPLPEGPAVTRHVIAAYYNIDSNQPLTASTIDRYPRWSHHA